MLVSNNPAGHRNAVCNKQYSEWCREIAHTIGGSQALWLEEPLYRRKVFAFSGTTAERSVDGRFEPKHLELGEYAFRDSRQALSLADLLHERVYASGGTIAIDVTPRGTQKRE